MLGFAPLGTLPISTLPGGSAVAVGTSVGSSLVLGISAGTVVSAVGMSIGNSLVIGYLIDAAVPIFPAPYFPPFPMLMPETALDGMIRNLGVRLGWMKSHNCACTLGGQIPGSPNPNCNTCHGRGVYWDRWTQPFTGLITFMHTSSAPDEPGAAMDKATGQSQFADPTLTIPYKGPGIEHTIWRDASEFDAYVELDATTRYSSVMMVGESPYLPYQQELDIQSVAVYDPVKQITSLLPPTAYTINGGAVTLDGSFPDGTGYTVEYYASPVYVAFRRAGGMPHVRPFGAGTGQVPRRFRIVALDLWTRARQNGFAGRATSPQALLP